MRVPFVLYENAPNYWVVLGMLFIMLGIYVGFLESRTYLYYGVSVGFACCAWGLWISAKRSRNRGAQLKRSGNETDA